MSSWLDPLRRLHGRLDGLARAGLCADDLAEAAALDRNLWQHRWRWLAIILAALLLVMVLVHAAYPPMEWRSAFLLTTGIGVLLLLTVLAPYYGYRKIARQSWRHLAATVIATVVSALVALFVVWAFDPSTPFGVMHAKVVRALALSLLLGIAVGSITLGIARMRLREATQRSERMAAEADRERLARQTVQAELKLLQAQIEPHFLFNTLSNVRHLVQSGSRDAVPMLDHLIDYLRTALPDIRADTTTLGREAELARAYLEIMRMRMGGELRFSIEVAPELREHRFPPLMLMTLVENAVKHGVAPVGRGDVRVLASRRDDRLVVAVCDDGRGLGGPIGQGLGLANVRERLRALYGEAAVLALESAPGGGTVARLEVPA
jgi:sensor histidine kinase YesM